MHKLIYVCKMDIPGKRLLRANIYSVHLTADYHQFLGLVLLDHTWDLWPRSNFLVNHTTEISAPVIPVPTT